jgi:hypothetical protein
VALGLNALRVFADSITVSGDATGGVGSSVQLAPAQATGSIDIAVTGGTATLQISQDQLDRFAGVRRLTIGRNTGTGAITAGDVALPTDVTLLAADADIALNGTVDSAVLARSPSMRRRRRSTPTSARPPHSRASAPTRPAPPASAATSPPTVRRPTATRSASAQTPR